MPPHWVADCHANLGIAPPNGLVVEHIISSHDVVTFNERPRKPLRV